MSEVIGFILVFSIVTFLMVGSMVAFRIAEGDARRNVESLQARSAAGRTSGLLVKAALLAERQGTTAEARFMVDLPAQFQGRNYQVALEAANAQHPARVVVTVPADAITETATLFAADAPASIDLCPTTVPGGTLLVRFAVRGAAPCLFLEAA